MVYGLSEEATIRNSRIVQNEEGRQVNNPRAVQAKIHT